MRPPGGYRWIIIVALTLACASDEPAAPSRLIVATGTVTTLGGDPLPGVRVTASTRNHSFELLSRADTVPADAAGAFAVAQQVPAAVGWRDVRLFITAIPPIGSGYPVDGAAPRLNLTLPVELVDVQLSIRRVADPVPTAPPARIDPDSLLPEQYYGRTVPPYMLKGNLPTELGLRVDSVRDAIYGRWIAHHGITIPPVPPVGWGTFQAYVDGNTVRAVLIDTLTGVPGGHCGGTLELDLSATSEHADTLIAWLRRGTATRCAVDQAPFRLVRERVTGTFD